MDSYIINGVCRCCASQGSSKDIDSAYTWMGDEEIYSKMLRDCFDIALERSEAGHDGGICELCVTQLRNAFNFKKQVVNTEEMLKKRIHSDPFKTDVKLEVSREDPSDSDNDAADHDMGDDSSVKDFLVPIKMEVEVDAVTPTKAKRAAKAGTSSAKKPKLEAETSKNAPVRRLPASIMSVRIPIKRELKSEDDDDLPILRIKKANMVKLTNQIRVKPSTKKDSAPKPRRRKIYYKSTPDTDQANIVIKTSAAGDATVPFMRLKTGGLKMTKLQEIHKQINNIQTILLHTNGTPIGVKHGARSKNFGCVFCERIYINPADLKEHCLTHSNDCILEFQKNATISFLLTRLDITGLKCKLCDAEIDDLDEMTDHLSTIHAKKIFPTATKRIVPFKFNGDDMYCCLCGQDHGTFKTLCTHMNTHFKNYTCDTCDAGFVTERMLRTHMNRHEEIGTFKCSVCDREYDTEGKKRRHERIVHVLQGKTHACNYCGERFGYHALCIRHLHEKHGLPVPVYKCRACDAEFDAKRKLSRHIKKDHLMEKNYECSECDMKFFEKDGLKEHELKHNGKKDYKCAICLKAYGRKHTLRNHMRIHIDDRRFKCDHCSQTFVQKCSLKGHLKSRHNIVLESQDITPLPSKPMDLNLLKL